MWVMHVGQDTLESPNRTRMLATVESAIAAGQGEVWLEHDRGPALAIVVGRTRAMVMCLAQAGDAGYHATDPTASPEPSEEYVLANGQVDQYADRDTVEVRRVMPIVTHFLATMDRWPEVEWADDNAE